MSPERVPGRYVFVTLPPSGIGEVEILATVREEEGMSAVVAEADADRLGLVHGFVAGWITLCIESSLAAVGLTAAVSNRLAGEGISCNVIAGLRHDHLLVPIDRVEDAVASLEALATTGLRT